MEKEVTYEEWKKNPTPREMWVWDEGSEKEKRFVIYMQPKEKLSFNVIALDDPNSNVSYCYEHCAEIEKIRLMTKQELAWWLRKNPTREFTTEYTKPDCNIQSSYTYHMYDANEPVEDCIMVREDGLTWREPSSDLLD